MKKTVGKIFLRVFIKSFFIVFLLIGIGAISYTAVMRYMKEPYDNHAEDYINLQEDVVIKEARVEDISKNIIFSVNEENGEISKILLEIFHCEAKKLYYITVPIRTQFTMSDTLYQKLVPVYPAIPQVIKLSNITKYFPEETLYEYGALIIDDLFGINTSYYTVIPKDIYETIFVSKNITLEEDNMEEGQTVDRSITKEVFSDEYLTLLETIKTAEDLSNYIEGIYSAVDSNLSLNQKMNYFESYINLKQNNIYFEILIGEDKNSAYIIKEEKVNEQLENYMR
ncbi:hypothetical protein I5677_16875 [Mobilitalea sibirica]|uniref:Uncharacterized protein n=1 Tax=Mobilitalea sibirica TaxID=1462919 RepID=A0A8J7H4S2_9FIRM|nr:hypothetical protein [Mobilitalea sibirica]MBH1942568.1 hypothetical protein [Mobilitalea sibirica]